MPADNKAATAATNFGGNCMVRSLLIYFECLDFNCNAVGGFVGMASQKCSERRFYLLAWFLKECTHYYASARGFLKSLSDISFLTRSFERETVEPVFDLDCG